jgi:hypothetical protein
LGAEEAKLYINSSKYPWMLANLMQLDPDFLNTPEDVARVAQQMQDQMEAQQGQELQQTGG